MRGCVGGPQKAVLFRILLYALSEALTVTQFPSMDSGKLNQVVSEDVLGSSSVAQERGPLFSMPLPPCLYGNGAVI